MESTHSECGSACGVATWRGSTSGKTVWRWSIYDADAKWGLFVVVLQNVHGAATWRGTTLNESEK